MPKEEKENYTISDIYQGAPSSLESSHGELFTGYRAPLSEIGAPTNPSTANQIKEVNQLLNQGIIPIEVGSLKPEDFETIPKQHFEEINRMAKLTGAKISLHAPMIEPSGITEQGWNESNRELAEKQLNHVIERSVKIDDSGKMPVTIHSAGIPGTEYKMTPQGKKVEKLIVINQEDGKMGGLGEERKFLPGAKDLEKPEIVSPERTLSNINNSEWNNSLIELESSKLKVNDLITKALIPLAPIITEYKESGKMELNESQQHAVQEIQRASVFLNSIESGFNTAYDKAYKYSNEKDKEKLKQISEDWIKNIQEMEQKKGDPLIDGIKSIKLRADLLDHAISQIRNVEAPKIYAPIEDFAIDKSSKTFANVAFNSFKKFGSKSPIISIENFHPGTAFAYGEGMKKLITKTREEFVKKAIEQGYPDSEARTQADRMIGMTLDLGHLNMAKKRGFKDEDIIKEVEQIAKYVKHVHLSDNFGYNDTHLPPGMGDVPNKEILEKLEKAGFKGRKIAEAGGFAQQFGMSPYPQILEAMGSPIYTDGTGPYWNQTTGLQQGYFSGYGEMLPQGNYETFGAGFSQLPTELGGQKPGAAGSRMGGKPME